MVNIMEKFPNVKKKCQFADYDRNQTLGITLGLSTYIFGNFVPVPGLVVLSRLCV